MIRFSDVFVPEGDEARRQAAEILSDSAYDAARPTWFDRFAKGLWDALARLFNPEVGAGNGSVGLVLLVAALVAALVIAIVLWGRPRLSGRRRVAEAELLGERDSRTAAQLRAEAERSAAAGDWAAAVILRYRGLARGLIERDLIAPVPGATAQGIAREVAGVLPEEAGGMHDAAVVFDAVRYLGVRATPEHYATIQATDVRLGARRAQAVPA